MKMKVKKCASVVKSVVLGELRVTLVLTAAHSQRDSEFASLCVCVDSRSAWGYPLAKIKGIWHEDPHPIQNTAFASVH